MEQLIGEDSVGKPRVVMLRYDMADMRWLGDAGCHGNVGGGGHNESQGFDL